MTELYEENLWGKIEYLHERYLREHNHISNFLDMMAKYQNACFEFSKQITNILNKNYILSESNTSTLYKSMESYYKCLLMHSEAFKETFESIKINLAPVTKSITESFQKEKEMYTFYTKSRTIYNNSKAFLEKLKKEFNQKAKDTESLVYQAKKAKVFSITTKEEIAKLESRASESLANSALFEDKYIQGLNEANKSRENEIKCQKVLYNYYHNIDVDYYGKIKMMTGFFVSCLKRMYNSILEEIESFNKTFNKIDVEKDINDFVEKHKTNKQPESTIKFIPFKPAPELVSDSIISSRPNEKRNLIISYEVVLVFQKIFKYIRTDLNMEEERKKNRLRNISYKALDVGEKIRFSQNELKELYLLFKEKQFRVYFLDVLSKGRNKGFKKSQNLINDLGDLFLKILEYSEKEEDYKTALNCITLGQTFYYEKVNQYKNNDKIYLIEGIKENEWLNSLAFWEGVINSLIMEEVARSEDIKNNEKDKKNIFNKIVYTQMFNYTSIMLEFNIKKEDISKLVENLAKKYQLKEEDVKALIKNINEDKKTKILAKIDEKIEKRKEKEKAEKLEEEGHKKDEEDKKEEEKEENEIKEGGEEEKINDLENEKVDEDKKEEIKDENKEENIEEKENIENEKKEEENKTEQNKDENNEKEENEIKKDNKKENNDDNEEKKEEKAEDEN